MGSVVVTRSRVGHNLELITVVWTSDVSTGAVSGNPFSVGAGALWQVKFIPGAGAVQPTNLYDITVNDADGCDVVVGKGANLSNTTASLGVQNAPLAWLGGGTLDVVVANAGNRTQGTVMLWIGRQP